jgi:hypothetical protein
MDVNNNENTGIVRYANLLSDIKTRIRQAQVKATLSANAKMNQDHESFLPQHVAKSGSSDFSLRPDAKLPLGDLILSIPWGHHIFDFLTLAEPFNEREVKKLGAVCNKYLNCGTASTQKTEYLSGNIHWVSGADVWE